MTLTQHSFRIRKIEIDAMQAYADLQDLPLAVVIRNALNLYAFAADLAVNHQLAKIDVTGEIIERLELSPPRVGLGARWKTGPRLPGQYRLCRGGLLSARSGSHARLLRPDGVPVG